MSGEHPTKTLLDQLIGCLELSVGGADKAFGQVLGSPVTMTILGVQPLALLFGFKIQSQHPAEIALPEDVAELVNKNLAKVSLEDGIAWLSLDDLSDESSASIARRIHSFAESLAEADIRLPAGCAQCRSDCEVALVYADGRCSRLCASCRGGIAESHLRHAAKQNRLRPWFALALSLTILYVSCGWMALWWLMDAFLAWRHNDEVALGVYDFWIVFALLAAIAGAIGYPLGAFLSRSGVTNGSNLLVSSAVVLLACGIGEWLYVGALIYRQTGIFDPLLAARMVAPLFLKYQMSWLIGKALAAVAIIVGCNYATTVRRTLTVPL
jgi:hypothetical protein